MFVYLRKGRRNSPNFRLLVLSTEECKSRQGIPHSLCQSNSKCVGLKDSKVTTRQSDGIISFSYKTQITPFYGSSCQDPGKLGWLRAPPRCCWCIKKLFSLPQKMSLCSSQDWGYQTWAIPRTFKGSDKRNKAVELTVWHTLLLVQR